MQSKRPLRQTRIFAGIALWLVFALTEWLIALIVIEGYGDVYTEFYGLERDEMQWPLWTTFAINMSSFILSNLWILATISVLAFVAIFALTKFKWIPSALILTAILLVQTIWTLIAMFLPFYNMTHTIK